MNDIVNGLFEFVGALLCCLHVRNLLREKKWSGISWVPFVFFTSWGYWNLYYYPSVNCPYSFAGGALLALVNTVYCGLLYRYRSRG